MATEGPQALPESASVPVPAPVKTGPPKKGEGKPPSIAQKGLTLSKVPVKLSSFLQFQQIHLQWLPIRHYWKHRK